MSTVSRSDVYIRDERGPDWFSDFLRSLANTNPTTVQDILGTINNKRSSTIEGVVAEYREMVGLDALSEVDFGEQVKQASVGFSKDGLTIQDIKERIAKLLESGKENKTIDDLLTKDEGPRMYAWISHLMNEIQSKRGVMSRRPLSVRQAAEQNAVDSIESNPDVKAMVVSLCEHSGGTKNTHSIIEKLRDRLGKELISYTDENLKRYIEKIKDLFRGEPAKEIKPENVGRVGLDSEDSYVDDVADYITNDGRK